MSKWIVDIHGDIEGDYEIIEEYKEPITGHWIDHQEDRWIYAKCSECQTIHDTQTNFCPNCGVRMENE